MMVMASRPASAVQWVIMRRWLVIGTALLLASCGGPTMRPSVPNGVVPPAASSSLPSFTMELTSTAFVQGSSLPSSVTCDGQGALPPLVVSGVPSGAKTLALIVADPDAPSGNFVHWTAWNIPPQNGSLAPLPPGSVQGMTSIGEAGWVPPCPPSGSHRYVFTVFALDVAPDLTSSAGETDLRKAMEGHVLAETKLVGKYQRTK